MGKMKRERDGLRNFDLTFGEKKKKKLNYTEAYSTVYFDHSY